MLIWFILFLIIVAISFVLAYQSMGDYEDRPINSGKLYTLYLIQKPQALTLEILNNLYQQVLPQKTILSFERLFKGQKSALVLFGPSLILNPLTEVLGLMELEDYSQEGKSKVASEDKQVLAWEVSLKQSLENRIAAGKLTEDLPAFLDDEQFWWQLILKPTLSSNKQKDSDVCFQAAIRNVFLTRDKTRIAELEPSLFRIGSKNGFLPLPQVYSSKQMLDFYGQRTLPTGNHPGGSKIKKEIILKSSEIITLLGV